MNKYDIFISYRRSSFETANLVATRLRAAGYSVFFDMETLRSGKFNEQLFDVIDHCTDFVVVLPPNALDRCGSEDDWVRLEVCRAMAGMKNIIPVMLNGFVWPDPMPEGMEELAMYQGIASNSIEYFDMAMERLMKRYLLSKPHVQFRRLAKYSVTIILALFALSVIAWAVFFILSKDVCLKYATSIANDAAYVHLIAEENASLERDWREFEDFLKREVRPERIVPMQEDIIARIDLAQSNLSKMWMADSTAMQISPYHSFLLSLHGINAEEVSVSPVFATLYYTDYLDQLEVMRGAAAFPNALSVRFATALFEVFEHSINSYYASVLSELSSFPENSRVTYNELHRNWIYFQKYGIGQKREYYEDVINTESKLAEDILARFESIVEEQDAQLEDLQRQNDELENKIEEGFSQIRGEQEIAAQKERVNTKEQLVEATKAELEDLDRQYLEVYEALKKKCTIEESDDQWYKWGKIRRWGSNLVMLVQSRQELKSKGIYSTSSVTPEVAYADMATILKVYQTYHPESAPYVASAKEFYRQVSRAALPYAGVLIFAFKDDATHPFLRQGDIIVGYNGKQTKSYNDLKAAFKEDNTGTVTYLRLTDGDFEELTATWEETGIVGFLDLTE